jgi:hypothetical protein
LNGVNNVKHASHADVELAVIIQSAWRTKWNRKSNGSIIRTVIGNPCIELVCRSSAGYSLDKKRVPNCIDYKIICKTLYQS